MPLLTITTTLTPYFDLRSLGLTECSENEWYDERGEPALERCVDGQWSVYIGGEHYGEVPTKALAVAVWVAFTNDPEWSDLIEWAT